MIDISVEPFAEDAVLLRFGDGIDVATNARVHAAARALRAEHLAGIIDIAPAYATLLVRFDPFEWLDDAGGRPLERIADALAKLNLGRRRDEEHNATGLEIEATRVVQIPVCYGDEYGPDLDAVAEHSGVAPGEVISRHTAADYSVAMLGFAPGFPYLLGLDPVLHAPRRSSPRTRVPGGSVAIGGAQTGIYPRELPGGWNLVGRTPLALFDPQREPPCLLAPGDGVRFRVIGADEFARLAEHGG